MKKFMITFSDEQYEVLEELMAANLQTGKSAFLATLLVHERELIAEKAKEKRAPGRPLKGPEEQEKSNIPHPYQLKNEWGMTGEKPWNVTLLTRTEYEMIRELHPEIEYPDNPTTIEEYNRDKNLWTGKSL